MSSSPFRPAGPGSAPADWPPRPDPPRDLRRRLTQLTGRLSDRARSASMSVGAWRLRSGSSGDADETPSGRGRPGRSQTRLVGTVIATVAVLLVAIGGSVVGRALERQSEHGVASGPVVAATPPTGGLPLVAGTIGAGTGVPGPGTAPTAGSSQLTSTTTSLVAVHAAGAVARPGVYLLPVGARVDDVLAAAGGAAADADLDSVNLAEGVVDGERVAFPRFGQPAPTITAPTRASTPAASGADRSAASTTVAPVDLNTASSAELDLLPGVGPATAAAIIEFRVRNGRFRTVTQLLDVPGIGDAKLAALKPRVRV